MIFIDESVDRLLASLALAAGFLFPWLQARRLAGSGSDHPVHVFLVETIRENGRRLFSRVPRIVNPSYCGAFPLYLHWILSYFGTRAILPVARLLNPCVNLALIALAYGLLSELRSNGYYAGPPGLAALALALTPQFLHAFSARNFGLSSRPLGLLFVTALLFVRAIDLGDPDPMLWGAEIALVFAIAAFNTFALQFLVLFTLPYVIVTGDSRLLISLSVGLAIFIAVHPRYSISYLKHTALFIRAYQRELASIFILPRRPSVWLDLVRDIPAKLRGGPLADAAKYAYGNPVLILIALNPLAVIGLMAVFRTDMSQFADYAASVTLVAVALFIATSFRSTRFLGEPERYIELVTPLACVAATELLAQGDALPLLAALLVWSLLANIAQLGIAWKLQRHIRGSRQQLCELADVINMNSRQTPVVFSSNSEEVIKTMMAEPWQFVRYWSFETKFAGLGVREVFSTYPNIRMDAFCRIAAAYGVNIAIIDKAIGETPPALHAETGLGAGLLYETERYAVFRLSLSGAE